jgi:hypothetical protein
MIKAYYICAKVYKIEAFPFGKIVPFQETRVTNYHKILFRKKIIL